MNSLERVKRRLEGKPVDQVPNLNIVMQFAAKYIGVPYSKYCTDYKYLVEGNIKCCQDFGIDMVSTISDPLREAQGFGSHVIINYDDVPFCKEHLIKEYSDIKKLKITNTFDNERMIDRIRAVELFKILAGNEYPILGWVEGPFAEASILRGINEICIDLIFEPNFVNELLEICLQNAITYAKEQILKGAQFIGIGDAAASLLSPELYNKFVLPLEKKLIDEIHSMGAKVKLHICGNISHLLDFVVLSGADIIDIDWMVDFKKAVQIFKGKACACGNFDPVKVLLQGNISNVKFSVEQCLKEADNFTFIAAGCEVPKFTPYQNLKAVNECLVEHTLNNKYT